MPPKRLARPRPHVGSIAQTVRLPAAPMAVYAALMESRQHAAFTGGAARIDARRGGKFTTYDGYATGRFTALVPGARIASTWRADGWREGITSQVSIELVAAGKGTSLRFEQVGVPRGQVGEIRDGWREFYWVPLKKYLGRAAAEE